MKNLKDFNVVFFESRHAKTLGGLIKLQGGCPIAAPSMKEAALENNPVVFSFGEKLFGNEVDILVLLTGAGTKALITVLESRYPKEQILTALRKIIIIPRGPKPVRALNELTIPYAVTVPEPNTWREILKSLDEHKKDLPLNERRVFVQEYGARNFDLLDGLEKRGARVTPVPVYRWELPDDLEPLKNAVREIIAGKIQIAVFTTAVQIDHVLKVGRFLGIEKLLKTALNKIGVASVGPDCTEAIRAQGIQVDIQPASPKMGPLVLEIAEKANGVLEKKLLREGEASHHVVRSLPVRQAGFAASAPQEDSRALDQSVFMKACRLEKTPYTPVWLMRQAGRYMKEYRRVRDKVAFLDICKNKDLVTEITVTAQEKIKADAAIIFSDILVLVEAFGLGLEYLKGDGPSIKRPILGIKEVEALPCVDCKTSLSFVYQAIRQTRLALQPSIPLIGFAGAPFTIASYMIEGGASKDFRKTKDFMSKDGRVWEILMKKITDVTAEHLNHQIEAGAQAVQLFDSWIGCLSAEDYEKYVSPFTSSVIKGLKKGTPVIHFGTGTSGFLESFARAGGDVISVDHRIQLSDAWKKIGLHKALQGNLDPQVLLSDTDEIRKETKRILDSVKGRAGHIFNLGHGVLPETPVENVMALVEMVHEISAMTVE